MNIFFPVCLVCAPWLFSAFCREGLGRGIFRALRETKDFGWFYATGFYVIGVDIMGFHAIRRMEVLQETLVLRKYKMKNISTKIVIWLTFLSSFTQMKAFGQSGIILNIPVNDTLLLKGNVNVLHGPDHYYKDTTFVEYIHYIMIYKQGDTIKYHEIFDSPQRDSLIFDSYTFQVINDTMYFFY